MTKLDIDDPVQALAELQANVLRIRREADLTTDPEWRNVCLRMAAAVEEQTRKLDGRGC